VSEKWIAIVELWPYHGISQMQTGPRSVRVIVGGHDILQAMASVEVFVLGLKTNPNIWQAPVMSLARSNDQHDRIGDCGPYMCKAPEPGEALKAARETVERLSMGSGG
jgi:hypothetical protein